MRVVRKLPRAAAMLALGGVTLSLAPTDGAAPTPDDTRPVAAVVAAPAGDPTTLPEVLPSPTAEPTPGPDAASAPTSSCSTRASTDHPITRISGGTRAGTAACASQFGYPDGATVAILARGDAAGGLADALAGTVLAHARGGPVVLAEPRRLPDETRDELVRLGTERVVVLGGTTAISRSVEQQVRDLGITTTRLAGSTRAGTAAAIADEVGGDHVFVVNGRRPADALVAGAAAARDGAALLLVDDGGVPDETAEALMDVVDATIVGGFGVVGQSVDDELRRAVANVQRLGGATRHETAATVARAHPGAGTLHLVSGADANLVDAIAGGWLGARDDGGPVGYVAPDTIPGGTDRWLRLGAVADAPDVRVLGGTGAVSDDVVRLLDERFDEAAAGGPADELRGMWVHLFDPSLKTRAGIERVLDAATGANLNTLVVQVARRSDAYYRSDVIPRTPDPSMTPDLDLLAELLPAAHARGLDVHTWFSVMPSDHHDFDDEVLPPDHVNVRHGPESDDPWMTTVNLAGYDYMDPAIPGVQDHVVAMIREVAERYDVDGIHLDYLRYAGMAEDLSPPLPEHPVTEQRFADHRLGDESKHEFLAEQTRDIARRVYLEVAEVAPDVVVSAAVLAMGAGPTADVPFRSTRPYSEKAQDWPSWLAEGIVDDAFPMMYFDQDRYGQWYEDWRRFARSIDSDESTMAAGLGAYLNDDEDKAAQMRVAVDELDGAVIYSYQSEGIGGGTPWFNSLADTTFATPASPPVVPRKAAPTRGHLLVTAADGDIVEVHGPGDATITRRADATGHAGFVHLAPGTWEVRHDGQVVATVEISAGVVTRATLG